MSNTLPEGFPADHKFTKEFLLTQLAQGRKFVRFTKVKDGSDRIMECTTNKDLIRLYLGDKATDESVEAPPRKTNENTILVFDIEKRDWRTFRTDTVYHCGSKP